MTRWLPAGEHRDHVRVAVEYAIRGVAEVLLKFEQNVPEHLRDDVQLIDNAAADALALVNRQIGTAQDSSGRAPMTPGPVHVDELLDALERVIGPLARGQATELRFGPAAGLPLLHTDGLLLAQVLRSLAANAIRHAPGGTVLIAPRVIDAEMFAIDVHDSGPPIHPDDHDRIFQAFERAAEDPARGDLGLPLARRLARLLGGDVQVSSAAGRGSTFTATVTYDAPKVPVVPHIT